MKKFVFLTYGFERPTPEIMAAWGKWFESMKDNTIDKGHFPRVKPNQAIDVDRDS